jgi:hypothetical protein
MAAEVVRMVDVAWTDPTLSVEQRVAAALDAGLALGERLVTVLPGTPEQEAYAEGWFDGWAASEHEQAQAWRALALKVRHLAGQPSYAELAERRGDRR